MCFISSVSRVYVLTNFIISYYDRLVASLAIYKVHVFFSVLLISSLFQKKYIKLSVIFHHLMLKTNSYVAVQFYPWFNFDFTLFFLC